MVESGNLRRIFSYSSRYNQINNQTYSDASYSRLKSRFEDPGFPHFCLLSLSGAIQIYDKSPFIRCQFAKKGKDAPINGN